MKRRINVIGITGGIASGKSTIAVMLGSLGAKVVNADEICHQLINTEEIRKRICEKWGTHLRNKQGEINRGELGKIVFKDKEGVLALNRIIHPKAIRQIKKQISELVSEDSTNVIVLDVALLMESNLSALCDIILFVDTKKKVCVKRVQEDRKWTAYEITKREKFQNTILEKRKHSNIVIDNNISKESTFKQINDFWDQFIIKKTFGG